MKLYTGLCAVVLLLLSFLLAQRKDVDATVMRTPGFLFQEVGPDSISNLYNIKMINKTMKDMPVTIKLVGENGRIETIGKNYINVVKEGQGSGSFFVILPNSRIHKRSTPIKLDFYQGNKKITDTKTNFLGPVPE